MVSYTVIRIILLLLLVGSFLGIVIWLFRPKSKEKYEEFAKIPLKEDEDKRK